MNPDGAGSGESSLVRLLEWIVELEPAEARAMAQELRRRHPEEDRQGLARRVFSGARWRAAVTGVATGAPSNPLISGGAALIDVGAVLRMEARACARVACVYDDAFFVDEDAKWEVLVPVFGLDVVNQLAREVGVRSGMTLTRRMVRAYLSKGTLETFKKLALQYLGIKVTQRAVITKTVPIVGGVIGGAWNFGEVTLLRNRCIAYFEDRGLATP